VAREINADLKTDVGLTGEFTAAGREMQDVAKEISTALKPDLGLPQESNQAAGGMAEDAPSASAVDPIHSARETNGESGQP
jgi:hypothetical protein